LAAVVRDKVRDLSERARAWSYYRATGSSSPAAGQVMRLPAQNGLALAVIAPVSRASAGKWRGG